MPQVWAGPQVPQAPSPRQPMVVSAGDGGTPGPRTGGALSGWEVAAGDTGPCLARGCHQQFCGAVPKGFPAGHGQAPSSLYGDQDLTSLGGDMGWVLPGSERFCRLPHTRGEPVTCRAWPGSGKAGSLFSTASSQCRRASSCSCTSSLRSVRSPRCHALGREQGCTRLWGHTAAASPAQHHAETRPLPPVLP